MLTAAALEGFGLGAGLIIAIGAQNAFVLRQGLMRRHVGPLVALCAGSDALLILAGAFGFGSLVSAYPALLAAVAIGGAAFLAFYGIAALRRAIHPAALLPTEAAAQLALGPTLGTAALLTYLNPHVYLDTVVLLGGIAGRYGAEPRAWFVGGAMLASLVWFTTLGYGARLLGPLFAKPAAWRVLDMLIAVTMFSIAGNLLADLLWVTLFPISKQ